MARLLGQVERLEGAAALLVQDVQALHEANVVTHLGVGAGAAATVEVGGVGRAAD